MSDGEITVKMYLLKNLIMTVKPNIRTKLKKTKTVCYFGSKERIEFAFIECYAHS